MGTNYYWFPHPGGDPIHIGKSSGGWCFYLHVIPEAGICDLADWEKKFAEPQSWIQDEEDRVVQVTDMMKIITERSWGSSDEFPVDPPSSHYESWAHFHDENCSQFGPRGLLRFRISRQNRCIGHGSGTWDLVTGDFS